MSTILPYELTGNRASNQILVFAHGWPDTPATWNCILHAFEKDYYVLRVSYPNYSQEETNPKGLDFEEIADRIKLTIDYVNDTKRRVVLVSHDWGCIFGYYLDQRHPKYISEMIAIDVGAKFTLYKPFVMFYQMILLLGFIIGGAIGRFLTQYIVNFFKYAPSWKYRIDSSWNYPYYYAWKKILLAGFSIEKALLNGYEPSCNVAFVYGTKKSFQFYNKRWLDILKKNPKNEVHAVDGFHSLHREQPEFMMELILRKLVV